MTIIGFVGCKSGKNKNNNNNNTATDTFIPGEDFDFYGHNGYNFVELGGRIDVTPYELLNVGVKFKNSFLNVIADMRGSWPYSISLELRKTSGGSSVISANTSTTGINYLNMSIVNYILNQGAGDYYLVACDGGFGSQRCSGVNKLHYQGEENSSYFSSGPTGLTGNSGCTTISFNMGYYAISNIYSAGGYFSQIEVYRDMQAFTDPDDALEKFSKTISYVSCYSQSTCTVSVNALQYTNPGYIGVRVRDLDGKLSPLSNVIGCQ